jgi:hypothetical protein
MFDLNRIMTKIDTKADEDTVRNEFGNHDFKISDVDRNTEQNTKDIDALHKMIKQLYAAIQELNSSSGSALVSKKQWQPINCLSCGRGDANYAPLAPNVKGRDGRIYKGDVNLTKP